MTISWSNWAGNQTCHPTAVAHPADEDELRQLVIDARRAGTVIRPLGAGHSFTPICVTDGVIVSLDRLNGVTSTDPETLRVVAGAGTRIRDFGDPLWEVGLCLKNQGDIDAQHIAGAIGTATHGSGRTQQCFSATAKRFRVVGAQGDVFEVSEEDSRLLAAMRVSIGMLGIVTEVELEVRKAFGLAERIEYWPLEMVLERWDDEMAERRHFSFFWMPYDHSPDTLFMSYPEGMSMADRALVKLYDEVHVDALVEPIPGSTPSGGGRTDRPYRIYPDPDFEGDIVSRELEYMVPFAQGKAAFLALRKLVLTKYPHNAYPVEVRAIAADDAWLSPFYERDSVSISICGHEDLDYVDFLADVARVLDEFGGRPHWGKLHYVSRERADELFPRIDDFRAVRRELDPDGLFLTPSLRELFA